MKPSEQTINDLLNIIPAVLYEYVQNQDGSGIFRYVSPIATAKSIAFCCAFSRFSNGPYVPSMIASSLVTVE